MPLEGARDPLSLSCPRAQPIVISEAGSRRETRSASLRNGASARLTERCKRAGRTMFWRTAESRNQREQTVVGVQAIERDRMALYCEGRDYSYVAVATPRELSQRAMPRADSAHSGGDPPDPADTMDPGVLNPRGISRTDVFVIRSGVNCVSDVDVSAIRRALVLCCQWKQSVVEQPCLG